MKLPKEIHEKKTELFALCMKYNVSKLFVFGSVTKGRFNPDSSDLDLLVDINEIDPVLKGESLINLWNDLEALFERKVDLLTMQKIKNPFLQIDIDESKQLIYDKAS